MQLKTPSFWYDDSSASALPKLILTPFSYFYRLGFDISQRIANPYRSRLPVICIGNLTAGGSGKSPCAIAIKDLLSEQNLTKHPCFLIRGYKGSLKGPVLVDPNVHTAKQVGDEALMLAKHGHVIVSKDRKEGAILAEKKRFDMIIMDDGLQNPQLEKDYKIIVVNGFKGFGNQGQIPAGPLRQSIESGIEQADCVIIIGEDEYGIQDLVENTTIFHATYEPAPEQNFEPNVKTIAFAAIAHPDNFKRTLESIGVAIKNFYSYPDHKTLKEAEELELVMEAYNSQAQIITTEKDYVRLSEQSQQSPQITFLKMDMNLLAPDKIIEDIGHKMRKSKQAQKSSDTHFE